MKGVSYKIIGGDGHEYGPIGLNEVRDWIDDQRVAPETRVWSSEDQRWIPALERPELKWNFETPLVEPALLPPVLPPAAVTASAVTIDNAAAIRAPLVLRCAAIVCDYVIFTVSLSLLTSPWSAQIRELNETALKNFGSATPDPKLLWDMLSYLGTAVLPASFVYYAAIPALFGATPGKLIARLSIVRADGGRLTWARATVRWLAAVGCALTFGVGFLPIFFTPRRQGLHDLIAGTCVIRRTGGL